MKETLEILGFIISVSLLFILAGFISMNLSAETPIPDIDKPTPPEKDICWYVNDIKCCKDSFRCLE